MIKIAFYWHQHQPYYKDNLTGEYSMPWVRLHGIKDYIGMALLLEEFPNIRQTLNYVPCLLDQLIDYEKNQAVDWFWKLAKIPAEDLTEENKLYILDNFFSANHQNMIEIYPRYKELFKKRNFRRKRAMDVLKDFSNKDFQDLQVWSNLSWYHPLVVQKDPLLLNLFKKGEEFTKEEKEYVLSKQVEVIGQIIPIHRRLQDAKQIEITTSPYYHPILPLLCDQESAQHVLPKLSLPKKRMSAVEDAKTQVEKAVQVYEKYFDQKPRGMWPSEGAVSDDIVPILSQAGFRWMASDEEILACSLDKQILRDKYGDVITPEMLYKPYRLNIKGSNIDIVFRDHNLSDLIGFKYSKYSVDTAVSDFINRINSLKRINNNKNPILVSIILDGENAWEYYPNSGLDFLRKLYQTISSDNDLECVRICDYIEGYPPEQTLQHICPGSWIGHNLATWIGHEEKNTAWNFIENTRSFLMSQTKESNHLVANGILDRAWEEIFIAEGSDWFWWYGDEHFTHYKEEFDSLFRLHLKNVYKLLNIDFPKILDVPIIAKTDRRMPYIPPSRFLKIELDGVVSNYFEWLDAGRYNTSKDMDTMHVTSDQPINGAFFGFNKDNLYIRVDFNKDLFSQYFENGRLVFTFVQPHEIQIITSTLKDKPLKFRIKNQHYNGKDFHSVSMEEILELSCPFSDLGLTPWTDVEFFIELVVREYEPIQRVPFRTVFCFSVPSEDFEKIMWLV